MDRVDLGDKEASVVGALGARPGRVCIQDDKFISINVELDIGKDVWIGIVTDQSI